MVRGRMVTAGAAATDQDATCYMVVDILYNRKEIMALLLLSWYCPTNNELLMNFRLSSDAEILSMSTDLACKSAPNMQRRVCNVYMFRLSFHFAYHRWWLGCRRHRTTCGTFFGDHSALLKRHLCDIFKMIFIFVARNNLSLSLSLFFR